MQESTTLTTIQLGDGNASLETDSHSVNDLLTRLFGCWHVRLTRPITRDNQTYQACLRCGLRRPFDLDTWKAYGSFYAAPSGEPKGH
jgi:hypothetical protein